MLAIKRDTIVINDRAIPTAIATNVAFGILINKTKQFSKNKNEDNSRYFIPKETKNLANSILTTSK